MISHQQGIFWRKVLMYFRDGFNARDLDLRLIEAYLARRALDYLVGFNLSPVLWRKLPGSRSAGRRPGRTG